MLFVSILNGKCIHLTHFHLLLTAQSAFTLQILHLTIHSHISTLCVCSDYLAGCHLDIGIIKFKTSVHPLRLQLGKLWSVAENQSDITNA